MDIYTKIIAMDRKKLEKNIASNLTIDLDVEKYIEITLLDIEQYANQRVIEELEKIKGLVILMQKQKIE